MLKTASLVFFAIIVCAPALTAAAAIPTSFSATCGNIRVRFDKAKAYNMNSIIYKDKVLCIDRGGAHYGTVVNFPGVGFIGSGHTEVESERVIELTAFSDGSAIDLKSLKENAEIKAAKSFKLVRKSAIRDIFITNTITIKGSAIAEEVVMRTGKKVKVALLYNFMHPWTTAMTDYYAVLKNGKNVQGRSSQSKKFRIEKEACWVAVYSSKLEAGVVSEVIEACKQTRNLSRLWDRKQYFKYYLMSFLKQELPVDTDIKYKMKTSFFEAPNDKWVETAQKTVTHTKDTGNRKPAARNCPQKQESPDTVQKK